MVPTIAARPTASHRHLGLLARRTLARRPEAWVYAIAVVAAAVLLAPVARSANPGAPVGVGPSWLVTWGGWMLMVLAMMLPVVAPQARQVAMRSVWRRRHRAMAGYLSGYLAVWAVVGVVIVGALQGAHTGPPPTATAPRPAGGPVCSAPSRVGP